MDRTEAEGLAAAPAVHTAVEEMVEHIPAGDSDTPEDHTHSSFSHL